MPRREHVRREVWGDAVSRPDGRRKLLTTPVRLTLIAVLAAATWIGLAGAELGGWWSLPGSIAWATLVVYGAAWIGRRVARRG